MAINQVAAKAVASEIWRQVAENGCEFTPLWQRIHGHLLYLATRDWVHKTEAANREGAPDEAVVAERKAAELIEAIEAQRPA